MIYKRLFRIGCITYLILLFFSILFYKERTVFADIAYHMFAIITTNGFAIQNFRFGAIVTQIFPLFSSKLGWSLNNILILYSSCFMFYYFMAYLLCGIVLKNYRAALVLLLFNVLFVSHTFYWIQSELPQGIVFLVIFLAFIEKLDMKNAGSVSLALVFFFVYTICFFHPLMIFPFSYAVLFFLLNRKVLIDKKLLYNAALFFIAVLIIKKIAFSTEYDSHAFDGFNTAIHAFTHDFPHGLNSYSNRHFLHNCLYKYYWLPVLSILICLNYLKNKQWKLLGLYIIYFLGFLFMVNLSFSTDQTQEFYFENLYLPLGFFAALPFIYDLLPVLAEKKMAIILFSLILVSGILRIYTTHKIYTTRLNWERKFLGDHENEKIFMDFKKTPKDTLLEVWGTPYEFWLLSTTERTKTASINISENLDGIMWAKDNKTMFVPTWGSYQYQDLPRKYFIFKDTITSYSVIK